MKFGRRAYEKDKAYPCAVADRILHAVCVFRGLWRCNAWNDAVLRRDDRGLCDFVPMCNKARKHRDDLHRQCFELCLIQRCRKNLRSAIDGGVFQTLHGIFAHHRNLRYIAHHPYAYRSMPQKNKIVKRRKLQSLPTGVFVIKQHCSTSERF